MNTQVAQMQVVNGVNVTDLVNTVGAVKEMPGLAKFKFRISNQWIDCGHTQSRVADFHGAHQDHQHASTFLLEADEPAILLGQDQGANPVEHLLHALAACVTTSMVFHAAARGIHIEKVESTIEGNTDLRGFLGLDPGVRNGYESIRMSFRIKADVPESELRDLVQMGPKFSPVFDSISRGVPIEVVANSF